MYEATPKQHFKLDALKVKGIQKVQMKKDVAYKKPCKLKTKF